MSSGQLSCHSLHSLSLFSLCCRSSHSLCKHSYQYHPKFQMCSVCSNDSFSCLPTTLSLSGSSGSFGVLSSCPFRPLLTVGTHRNLRGSLCVNQWTGEVWSSFGMSAVCLRRVHLDSEWLARQSSFNGYCFRLWCRQSIVVCRRRLNGSCLPGRFWRFATL